MKENQVRVYGYRWVVLLVFALITAVIQIQWLTFAPIAREARQFYGVSALAVDFLLGFFLLGAGAPVGFQYCAEITRPAPESISQGLLLFTGQISGILFILFMNYTGMSVSMVIFLGLALINIGLSLALKESPQMIEAQSKK